MLVTSYFHFSLSVFLQVYYTFLNYIFPTASIFILSSSVYFSATSSYNVILPITILSPFRYLLISLHFLFFALLLNTTDLENQKRVAAIAAALQYFAAISSGKKIFSAVHAKIKFLYSLLVWLLEYCYYRSYKALPCFEILLPSPFPKLLFLQSILR